MPASVGDARFDYGTWSSDGRRLAGLLRHPSSRRTLGVHDLGSNSCQDLDLEAEIPVVWLNGDMDLLFLKRGKLWTVQIASRRVREVVAPPGSGGGRATDRISAFDLSLDRKTLFILRVRSYAEIWRLTLH